MSTENTPPTKNFTRFEATPPLDSREKRKRRREAIAILGLVVLFVGLTIAEFRLTKLSAVLPFVNSIFFFGLLNVNIIILIALVWLVFRNLGKLFIERRRKILGARLKTKLVISFLSLSIVPTVVLFIISALYINSSFDKWFSIRVQNTLQASLEITSIFYRNTEQSVLHFAEHLAATVAKGGPGMRDDRGLFKFLAEQRSLLALDAVEFYSNPYDERFLVQNEQKAEIRDQGFLFPRIAMDALNRAFGGQSFSLVQNVGTGALVRSLVPVSGRGLLVVNAYIPIGVVSKVDEVASVLDDLKDTNPLKYPIKTTYLVILVMITLVMIFVAIWIGLYMARELTYPVERLVNGAREVGSGNLDVEITVAGHDEIAVLIQSFNRMTRDLKENRERLTDASADLEKRRLELEAVLAHVETGVIAIDHTGRVTTLNPSAARLLALNSPKMNLAQEHPHFSEILGGDLLKPLRELIERVQKPESSASVPVQWTLKSMDQVRTLAAVGTPLTKDPGDESFGVVVVIDDLTHLIKGQREMAWREVARRIAHEIKNPLTPIKLSAQRLQRKLSGLRDKDGQLLMECTTTIIKHTDELKEMVNEFSNFARFPEINPSLNDLNIVTHEVVSLYKQAHPEIHFIEELEARLPAFEFDRDQIKRVLINLCDNAVSALKSTKQLPKVIKLSTHFNDLLRMAVIEIRDNGPGMTEEVRERVFEPYFSTKADGTGLGLAIAKRIVNDHDGFIRVHSSQQPGFNSEGTLFVIELPTTPRGGHTQGNRLWLDKS